jgi:hypothetical protein
MASIDICYAVAAYKSVTESLYCSTRYRLSLAHLLTMRQQIYIPSLGPGADAIQDLRA